MCYCILHQWDFQVSTGVFSYIIHPLVDLAKLTGSYLPVLCAFHNVEARCKIVAFSSSETCSLVTYMQPSVQLVLPDKSLLLLAAHISSRVTAVRSAGRVGDSNPERWRSQRWPWSHRDEAHGVRTYDGHDSWTANFHVHTRCICTPRSLVVDGLASCPFV